MERSEIKRRPLADTVLAGLEPEGKEYPELDGDGLYFRVKPDGSKSWQLRDKKADGKWSWLGLGGYGTGDHQLTGEQARRKVRELRDGTAKDGSIMATKRARKAAELEAANNIGEVPSPNPTRQSRAYTCGSSLATGGLRRRLATRSSLARRRRHQTACPHRTWRPSKRSRICQYKSPGDPLAPIRLPLPGALVHASPHLA